MKLFTSIQREGHKYVTYTDRPGFFLATCVALVISVYVLISPLMATNRPGDQSANYLLLGFIAIAVLVLPVTQKVTFDGDAQLATFRIYWLFLKKSYSRDFSDIIDFGEGSTFRTPQGCLTVRFSDSVDASWSFYFQLQQSKLKFELQNLQQILARDQ